MISHNRISCSHSLNFIMGLLNFWKFKPWPWFLARLTGSQMICSVAQDMLLMQYIGEICFLLEWICGVPSSKKYGWCHKTLSILGIAYIVGSTIDWMEHLKLLPVCHLQFYNAKSCTVPNSHFGFCVPCTVLHMELVALISMSCDRIVASNFRSCNAVLPYVWILNFCSDSLAFTGAAKSSSLHESVMLEATFEW